MKVTLIGKKSIYKITLPQTPIGNYWISDKSGPKEKKLINIDGQNGYWQVKSNNYAKIINTKCVQIKDNKIEIEEAYDKIVEKIRLTEYSMHCVTLAGSNEVYILYCSPVYEDTFIHLDMGRKKDITIGRDVSNDIKYNNSLISQKHARITYSNGRWIIENYDTKYGTFVNDTPLLKSSRVLLNGDIIFIMGLKIIIMGKGLYINNPLGKVQYDNQFIQTDVKNYNSNLIADEDNDEIYQDEEYYSRAPRIINKIETEEVKIDPPPSAPDQNEMPAFLLYGSTMTMGLVMVLSMTTSLNGISNGNGLSGETIFQIFMTFAMLVGMILFPILERKYEKRQKAKYEQKRQIKYKEYIDSKIKDIDSIMQKQRKILFDNFASVEECSNIILNKTPRLWERKIENFDFLTVRLGMGDVPLDINIQYPEKQFTMEEDNLVNILNTVGNKSKILKNAPIVMSLIDNNLTGLISKDDEEQKRFMKNIIMQLITFHSYEDLKLVFLLKEDKQKKWEHLKMLPHIWNNAKDIRFFTDDYEEMKDISVYLEEDFKERITYQDVDYKMFSPYYLIITDDYKKIENLKIIKEILELNRNVGFSIFCMAENMMQLPNECKTFIELEKGQGTIFESEMTMANQKKFTFDSSERLFFEKITQAISNIPIKYNASGIVGLPNTYTFLQMYDVGTIEQLNIIERWQRNDSTISLRAPIGIDGTGMPIALDIHEKAHGPHGLIAGSTGSGKSEFIITYILSLAINYHPDDVSFVLIDYKGGGLAGAFKKGNIKLPHLVGTITNIDTVGLQRSLDSIQSELRRRQVMFNEARNMTDEGTIDIYKYQKLYHEGAVSEPIPHLLIICDEFAELKQQQEEFMDELISVARIGRSLGVHLILATQKPAGIVNDQIRSNSKFSICLKVQDREDSNDVIDRPDAASLKNAGQFYMKVGNDEYFTLGQSAWSGAPYFPSDGTKKKIDTSIEFISNIGNTIKKVDDTIQKAEEDHGEQLTNIVKYVYELAENQGIETEQLWLDNVPETIYLDELKEKYKVKKQKNIIAPVIGEYDDPQNQRQDIVELNISEGGNTLIYGSADSGKETLLSTIVYDTIDTYTSKDVWLYLLDFGSEALKIFKGTPHVGDVVFMDNTEKIDRFFKMIQNEILLRKSKLSDFNGDINLFKKTNQELMPNVLIIINNYEGFSEYYQDKYDDALLSITREGVKFGINVIMTVSAYTDVRYRLSQNFKQRISLKLNNQDDYFNIFENVGKKRPSNYFGRGLVNIDEEIYEFQTAKICEAEDWNVEVKEKVQELKQTNEITARPIPIMPNRVTLEDIDYALKDIKTLPIGIRRSDLDIARYDFTRNLINIISSKNMEHIIQFIYPIIEELNNLEDVNTFILDAEKIIQTKKEETTKNYEKLNKQMEKTSNKNNICIIIGLDKFISELQSGETEFKELLDKAEELENYNFIVIDTVSKIKNHEYDEWYKNNVSGEDGLWIGNGVDDQYLIRTTTMSKNIVNKCGPSFGYIINQGDTSLVKLVGIKEKGDEDE